MKCLMSRLHHNDQFIQQLTHNYGILQAFSLVLCLPVCKSKLFQRDWDHRVPWDHRRRNQRNVFSVQSQLLQSECPAGNWDDQEEQWNSCDLLNLEWRTCFKYYKILCRVFLQYAPAQVYFIVLECSANHHTRKHHSTFFWSQILHIYLTVREIKSELYY